MEFPLILMSRLFNPPVSLLSPITQFVVCSFGLVTLPYHAKKILLTVVIYQILCSIISPIISRWLVPDIYNQLNLRTRSNWNIHFVALVQSVFVSLLAFYAMYYDPMRPEMAKPENWPQRLWGYTEHLAIVQAFGCGYFIWDLFVCLYHYKIFGFGLFAHALSALSVFSLGFRPFVNYYGPSFILYELSSPFLNIHWFCDKLNMTGSKFQLYNGIILLIVFFGCRLVWGTYCSYLVLNDVYLGYSVPIAEYMANLATSSSPQSIQIMQYAGDHHLPYWLGVIYMICNLTLNTLNFYWFYKMIQTLRKRFVSPNSDATVSAAATTISSDGSNNVNEKILLYDTEKNLPMSVHHDPNFVYEKSLPQEMLKFQYSANSITSMHRVDELVFGTNGEPIDGL